VRGPVRIAVTPGDPLGIGPEVGVLAAARAPRGSRPVLVGDRALWERAAALRRVSLDGVEIVPADRDADPGWGHVPELAAIATAVRGCLNGRWAAMSTGPIHKASLQRLGFPRSGHTPYLADLCGLDPKEAVMMFAGGSLTVVLVTVHVPLTDVPGLLRAVDIERVTRIAAEVVRSGWHLDRPRVAVCGLNPHAGEEGTLGRDEIEVVSPAVEALREGGLDVTGPWPPDTIFARAAGGEFDLVVALYHDQGLIPVKTLDFGRSVNITAGLPIVRTSVDHGTARDLAWTGQADARPAVAALAMACKLARARLPSGVEED
jgi:4-hydroxythreonine-4-phosphate dehydrogenase